MTDTEKKFKAAFMALLENYQNDIGEFGDEANNYCTRCCPFASPPGERDCPACVYEEYHDSECDECKIDEDNCREAIFNWYVENADG